MDTSHWDNRSETLQHMAQNQHPTSDNTFHHLHPHNASLKPNNSRQQQGNQSRRPVRGRQRRKASFEGRPVGVGNLSQRSATNGFWGNQLNGSLSNFNQPVGNIYNNLHGGGYPQEAQQYGFTLPPLNSFVPSQQNNFPHNDAGLAGFAGAHIANMDDPYNLLGYDKTKQPESEAAPDYNIHVGELLGGRYEVVERLGKGSFGQVVKAVDRYSYSAFTANTYPMGGREVAVKIIKAKRQFQTQARTEIALLAELNQKDPMDQSGIVRVLDTFIHKNHQCIVFELLSSSLYDLLKKTGFFGVSLGLVRSLAKQILRSLVFMEANEVIHCDLKPENILLRDPKRSSVKIIDLGSSCKRNKQLYTYIQSRFYRAPEVILEQPYSEKIDIWGTACLLVEMHTGEPLFPGRDQYEQLLRIVCMNGIPDAYLLNTAKKASTYFVRNTNWKWSWRFNPTGVSSKGLRKFPRSLEQVFGLEENAAALPQETRREKVYARRRGTKGHSRREYLEFIDLLKRMLLYDASMRISAAEALRHPFFTNHEEVRPFRPSPLRQAPERSLRRVGSAPILGKPGGGFTLQNKGIQMNSENHMNAFQQPQSVKGPISSGFGYTPFQQHNGIRQSGLPAQNSSQMMAVDSLDTSAWMAEYQRYVQQTLNQSEMDSANVIHEYLTLDHHLAKPH